MLTNGDYMIKIYGKNCINEAIKANAKLESIYLLDTNSKKDKDFIEKLHRLNYNVNIVNKAFMDKKFGTSHQGYAAIREDYKILSIAEALEIAKNGSRVLLLDGIMDPHNFGAILRTVDAFGIDLVILPKSRSVAITEVVAHVSTGAIEHTNICYANSLLPVVKDLKEIGYWICGTDASGDTLATSIDKDLKLAVIIGSEGFGMSKTLVNSSDYLITIPMVGHVNSLNASISTAIVLHDLMK